MKRVVLRLVLIMLSFILFSGDGFAVTLLTKEQALKQMFPDVDEIITETREMTDSEIARIRERLGGSLVHYQKGSESEQVKETTSYDLYIGVKSNQKIRMAIIEEQPGKWGPVEFIIAINTTTGKVQNLAVMSYKEKRGRPIARQNFLKQFFGKGSSDPISVHGEKGIRSDIRAISGATISSDCTCFAVRKVLALYENVFVKIQLSGSK